MDQLSIHQYIKSWAEGLLSSSAEIQVYPVSITGAFSMPATERRAATAAA